jgi:hypothetical protein
MTIRAHDVALGDLLEQNHPWFQEGSSGGDGEFLFPRVSVVEVHDPGWERSATVLTRPPPQTTQELERCSLPDANPLDLGFAMGGVVRDVVWTLVTFRLHIPS